MNNQTISQTEAGKILGKTKAEVHEMILKGQLTNVGNEFRFMVNKKELNELIKKGAHNNE